MKNANTFETTIERDGAEFTIQVTYDYNKGCLGARDSLGGVRGAGPPLEPDEPPSVESVWAEYVDGPNRGVDVELTPEELERIEEKCLENEADRYSDAMEARAESRRDDALFHDDASGVEEIERYESNPERTESE